MLIEFDSLVKHYEQHGGFLSGSRQRVVRAVDGISFSARKGQTLALVGESGCGKSTLAKVLTGLEVATRGSIRFDGGEIAATAVRKRDRELVRNIQMIFQNPFDTLNPKRTIGAQWARLKKFGIGDTADRATKGDAISTGRLRRIRKNCEQLSGARNSVCLARASRATARVAADEPVIGAGCPVQAGITED